MAKSEILVVLLGNTLKIVTILNISHGKENLNLLLFKGKRYHPVTENNFSKGRESVNLPKIH